MKKHLKSLYLAAAAVAGSAFIVAVPSIAQQIDSEILSTLTPGLWQFRDKSRNGELVDAICVGDVKRMVQIKNKNDSCSLKMIRSSGNSVTYDYMCAGKGKGQTTIRKETNKLVQVHSQGISGGEFFNFQLEARHAGSCR